MRSPQVCEILRRAFSEVFPKAEIVSLPLADGGEGTVEALLAASGGELRTVSVSGPLGKPVEAHFGLYNNGRSAVMEMSSASGLELIDSKERNPLKASTYGTGELLKAILDCGVSDITIGIGGSATVDGGAGMAQALGYKLLDAAGNELERGAEALTRLSSISAEGVDKRLPSVKLRVACDVRNPLLGRNGAARIYGPQKGATPAMIKILEEALSKLATAWLSNGMLDSVELPGDGAAGGLGAGLRAFCKARMHSGAMLLMDAAGFATHLKGASFVVTGEGCTDSQTDEGKLCSEVANAAKRAGVPCLLLSGSLKGDVLNLNKSFDVALSISTGHSSLEESIAAGRHDLYFTARNLAKLVTLKLNPA